MNFFFFKQKTAYELRISDWSSDVCSSDLDGDGGTIDIALAKVSTAETGWRMVGDPKGKPSVSHWEKLAVVGDKSLLRFRPETGRTHQLRVHALEGLGFPLVGDPVYGRGGTKTRTLLHAERLVVKRDVTPSIIAEAPLDRKSTRL